MTLVPGLTHVLKGGSESLAADFRRWTRAASAKLFLLCYPHLVPKPVAVRPTEIEIARDRLNHLALLSSALKVHTENVTEMLKPHEPLTFRELTTRMYLFLPQLPTYLKNEWHREWAGFKEDLRQRVALMKSKS